MMTISIFSRKLHLNFHQFKIFFHLEHLFLQIDDQIALLINAWCELLVFSCCYRSVNSPGLIRVSNEKSLDLATAKQFGIEKCIDKMLNFTEQLRRLKVDYYEYVSMKVIVLLTSGKLRNINLLDHGWLFKILIF